MTLPLPDAALDRLFHDARSFSKFEDRAVSDDQIRAIWDLMRMGPTSMNQLPARLVWCKSADAKERLAAAASPGNREKIRNAPVCVILAMDVDFHEQLPWLFPHTDAKRLFDGKDDARRTSAMRNSSLQGGYLILAARALGLDCGPMSGFDNAAVDAEFLADQPGWKSNFICSIGYGLRESLHPRGPRPDFDVFNRLI